MSLWVRNEKRLNMQCSQIISKDVRAVRSECATQRPRRALRITRLLFEILLLCLRRTQLGRKSTKIHPKWTPNRRKIDLGPIWAPKAVAGTRPDALGTGLGHPNAAPKPILGRPRLAKSGQKPSKSAPRAVQRRSESLGGHSQNVRKRRSHRPTQLEAFANQFFNVFGRRAAAPRCVSYRSCQCFIDVGRFARRMLAARKNLEKTAVLGLKIAPRDVLGSLGRASWGTKTAKSGSKTRKSRAKLSDFF